MPNPYFQLKEFTVYQDRCALKVSTDSCVFGAWLSDRLAREERHVNRCLDIGAGSGLLMLMLAQQFPGVIEGVEIDRASYEQATENIAGSPWHNRLRLYNEDVKLFAVPHRYDFIFSNPPFYEGDLVSPNARYNLAKHQDGLTLRDLLQVTERNLSDRGAFAVLLPWQRVEYFRELAAASGLYFQHRLCMRQGVQHPCFRAAIWLTRKNSGVLKEEELLIQETADSYSPAFTHLLKKYYLYL
jgi:tRNA1Val (adenine37-N6)-methyltransferase